MAISCVLLVEHTTLPPPLHLFFISLNDKCVFVYYSYFRLGQVKLEYDPQEIKNNTAPGGWKVKDRQAKHGKTPPFLML